MLSAPALERLCYVLTETPAPEDGYLCGVTRTEVDTVSQATLVGSRLTTGRHAPTLDVDHRAALTRKPGQHAVLWVEGLGASRWRGIRKALRVAGLAAPLRGELASLRRRDTLSSRKAAYTSARAWFVDEDTRMRVLRACGPELRCGFAEAVTTATLASAPAADSAHGRSDATGPDLKDPWPVPLSVPAMLLPSTSNHHLYLDAEMDWPAYAHLLDGLADNGLLEEGYVCAAHSRNATYLRLPWVGKTDSLLGACA